eukprot:GEMP01084828.1.p1 GENE.GEMP01084828.1~~GEMP01084828.1.p1  ORF type:complete len:279 (+),score=45.29 GEMP01084828.1:28-837(+)
MVPQEPFIFTATRGDAAMSPFFHNLVGDIKYNHKSLGEIDAAIYAEPAEKLPKFMHGSGTIESLIQEPPRFGCFKGSCKCEVLRPHVFLPMSLISDDDYWNEVYPALCAMGEDYAPFVRRTNDGRFLRMHHQEEHKSTREAMPDLMTFFEEYRQVKVMLEEAAEESRRKVDPFNPNNWTTTGENAAKYRIGYPNALCLCGHADLWHHKLETAATVSTNIDDAQDAQILEETATSISTEPSPATPREDLVVGEAEPQVRIVNGRLVIPGK